MSSIPPRQDWGISRQGTATSYKTPSRIQSWITGSPPIVPQQADQELVYDSYSTYKMETEWPHLKAWLETRFPGVVLPAQGQIRKDAWVFKIPQKLNADDRNEITEMRDEICRRKEKNAATVTAAGNGRGAQPSQILPAANSHQRIRSPERQRRY